MILSLKKFFKQEQVWLNCTIPEPIHLLLNTSDMLGYYKEIEKNITDEWRLLFAGTIKAVIIFNKHLIVLRINFNGSTLFKGQVEPSTNTPELVKIEKTKSISKITISF